MPFINLRGQSFFFERQGDGPPLVLIGGTGGDLRRPETQFAGPLPHHFDVLSWDQRGMGQSYKGSEENPFTMADYADDAAMLMEAQGWDDARVVGISFGGMVAQELVLRHPAKVRRLVLCCTASGGAGGASFAYHALPAMPVDDLTVLKVAIADTRRDANWIANHPAQYSQLLAMASADPFAAEPQHAQGAARQIAARATHDTWDRLARISCPVMVMGGRYDGIAKPEVVTALAQRISGSQLCFFEGGHLFMLEDKSAYEAITNFLTVP